MRAVQSLLLHQINIGNHRRQRCFQIVRNIGDQLRFHALIFKLVLHRQIRRLRDLIDICRQSAQLADVPPAVCLNRNPMGEIAAFHLADAAADREVLSDQPRHAEHDRSQHKHRAKPCHGKQHAADQKCHDFHHGLVTGRNPAVDRQRNAAEERFFPKHTRLKLLDQRHEAKQCQ